ncbi:hypothetical protein H5410_010275 [Solanum commersonii]|uniref:TF-B3 domain-containing protein n=1 Tax=Solanum commersonii TaxID=4109 RepID=A0A9J6AKW3_SOLCO|nr:hypothetical protein H5410_010275 [Solanum commersonii]
MENSLLKIDKRAIFYKIFCPSITNELLMFNLERIPAHFLRHISEESPDKATLKCLSGGTWNVKLQCDEDGLLIHKGWYDGALQFTVRIFSKNGLERQMKSTNMVKNKQASIDGGSKRKRPEKYPCTSKFPKQTCANGENDTEHETPRKRAALEKEEDLFVKCLKGYNVKKSCFLYVPRYFCEQLSTSENKTTAVLRNSEGKGWKVNCITQKGYHAFCGGWKQFVSDNTLKEGQVCVFQLVNANELKKIPTGYTNYKNGKLPRNVFLSDRFNNIWPMGVTRIGRDLYFQYGWEKFIEDNTLEFGDFIIFDYDGNETFDFKLLGITGCVKEGAKCEKKEKVNVEHRKSVELKEKNRTRNNNDSSFDDDNTDNYMIEEEDNDKVEVEKEEKEDDEEEGAEKEIEEEVVEEGKNDETEKEVEERKEDETEEEEDEEENGTTKTFKKKTSGSKAGRRKAITFKVRNMLDRYGADIFKSGRATQPKNPYFVAKILPKRRNQLYVPIDVVRDYKLELPPSMTIRDSAGREFETRVNNWKDGRIWLMGGWRSICRWNLVEENDKYKENIHRPVMGESVERGWYDHRKIGQPSTSVASRAIKAAKMFMPVNPYLQILEKYIIYGIDLLSIANVAEQREVWDFLINVDDAVDDTVRHFKGVSDGLMRKVFGSPSSSSYDPTTSTSDRIFFWNVEEIHELALTQSNSESVNSFSDNDSSDKDGSHRDEEVGPSSEDNGWHSDNELNSKGFTHWVVKRDEERISSAVDMKNGSGLQHKFGSSSQSTRDPVGVPPERIPADFLRHISEESPDRATLKCLSGGTWNVKLQCDKRACLYTKVRWRSAIHNKNFQQEWTGKTSEVTKHEHATPRKRTGLDKEEDLLTDLTPNIPQFVKCLKGYNVKKSCFLYVPKSFCERLSKSDNKTTTVQGKEWKVYCISPKGYRALCGGWKQFSSDNKLNKGHVCVFQLVNTNELKVSFSTSSSSSLLAPAYLLAHARHIFDLAATEIDYQFRSHGNAKLRDIGQDLSHIVGDNKDGESSVEILCVHGLTNDKIVLVT